MQIDWNDRFWSKVHPEALSGCWLWHGAITGSGYGAFQAESRRLVGAHRHAYELCHGPIPTGMVVRHKCDVRACVNPDHLETGTHADNIRDRDERGRHWAPQGEDNGRSKLTAAQVLEIRAKYAFGDRTQQDLADEYGVSNQLVSCIVRGKWWRHLTGGAL